MRWVNIGILCFSSAVFVKLPHPVPQISIAWTKILTFNRFQFHQFLSCGCHFSSSNESPTQPFHAKIVKDGSVQYLNVVNYVLSLYMKSEDLHNGKKLFDEMPQRDVCTWTILLSGLCHNGFSVMAFELFREMQIEGVFPNQFTLSCVLKSCSRAGDFRIGKGIHGWILRHGIDIDVVLQNSMLDVYAKFEAFEYVNKLFDLMRDRDTVTYNIMLDTYMHIGDVKKSLNFFRNLPYRDSASWNTMIEGLVNNGYEQNALELLYEMVENGIEFDKVTFSTALGLVSSLSNMKLGRQVHGRVFRFGVHNDGFVRNSLIDMYCKCGNLEKASLIFQKMPLDSVRTQKSNTSRNMNEIVSRSSMVSGYVRNGSYEDALNTFLSMVGENVFVDKYTITTIISACSNIGILELGRQIHAHIQKIGHILDAHLGSSLIDMYSKCGCLDDAWRIFKQIYYHNVVLWTSMISGCALHGKGREAIQLFEEMTRERIKPNQITFVGVLTACSHAGMIEEGCRYFHAMREIYGIEPKVEHFTCMVDLYGRAGRMNEIKEFIDRNGLSHLNSVWKAFLSSCRVYKDIDTAKFVSERLFQLEEKDDGPYVLLSNMCSANHRYDEAAEMRSLMRERGVNKRPGRSWLQIKDQIHSFVMGDRSHPQDTEIYSYLEKLTGKLKEIGYSSDVKNVMQDVEEEQGEILLGYHSEKLAIAYGIIASASGTPIRIMKNLRVCNDCHNFIKFASQLVGREIIVRDIHRFHHFSAGQCSCGDYW